jgi:hypothetical protein
LKQGLITMAVSLAVLFTSPAADAQACANQASRTGASEALPDCRAYELVTPSDSSGRSVEGLSDFRFFSAGSLFPTSLITSVGDAVAFTTFNGPLGDVGSLTGTIDVTGARRYADGWRVARRFSPGGEQAVLPIPGGISSDHLYAFTDVSPVKGTLPGGTLAAEGDSQYLGNPDGSFEPIGLGTVGGIVVKERLAQGRYISAGGEHVIFSTGRLQSGSSRCALAASADPSKCPVHRLADDAPPEGTGAVYDRSADGPTKMVSLLPSDVTPGAGQDAAFQGVSKDGVAVAFKISGVLYVRVADAGDGTTLKVAEGDPVYAGLSTGGHFLFYVAGGEKGVIHRFDTGDQNDVAVNQGAPGEVVNVSADGSHVYFITEETIAGQGVLGQPNLFAWSGGVTSLVGTVAPSDLEKTSNEGPAELQFTPGAPALTNWTDWAVAPELQGREERGPGAASSRTTPDGSVIVFESKTKLTGFENAGHTQIYRWDATNGVVCVSCNPRSSTASLGARLQLLTLVPPPNLIQNLSADGSRVFFETAEALLVEDVDGVNDVYEWQAGTGGASSLSLISSGRSTEVPPLESWALYQPKPNVIFGITPSGSDVVFLSQDELVPGAGSGGAPNLFDARVDGGFPTPLPVAGCVEEACRPPVSAANSSAEAPASETVKGSGNVKGRKHSRRCRAKKHQKPGKKSRCQKHKSKGKALASSGTAPSSDSSAPLLPDSDSKAIPPRGTQELTSSTFASASAAFVAGGEFDEFGIEAATAGLTTYEAGKHPDFTTSLVLNHFVEETGEPGALARTEDVTVKLPPGLIGNPNSVPRCTTVEFLAYSHCPVESQVGIAKTLLFNLSGELTLPIYNLEPPHPESEVARFGFYPTIPVFIDVDVRTASDYGVTATVHHSPGQTSLIAAKTIFWGNPTDASHDELRLTADEGGCPSSTACKAPGGKRAVARTGKAFMTNPSACQKGSVSFDVTGYQAPGRVFSATAPLAPIVNCQGLPFEPTIDAQPTSRVPGAPTGLQTRLVLPQHEGAGGKSTATMREARVTLPAGMQLAAGAANWVGTCSDAQVGFHEEVGSACPDSSKLGTVAIKSPALLRPLEGFVFQRVPSPGHQFGLWLVSDDQGLHVKIPGELEPDRQTGRLTAVFRDLPQVPVEEIDLDVWGGERAPLMNPDRCGSYATDYSFVPHSNDAAVTGESQMTIDGGCNEDFAPRLSAGVTHPLAGRYSPLVVDLTRPDGDQALRGFELQLPDGELAKIKGVPLCSDPAADAGSCPVESAIGHLSASTGPGPDPLSLPQPRRPEPKVYLAGPQDGFPFSIVAIVPAQAGPFDLGNVVVRSGLGLDPDTNRAVVKADPLPRFFEGVGLAYRSLRVVVDRPRFSLNPTDCRVMKVGSDVYSTRGTVAHPTSRFQVDGCKRLRFKPRLVLKLRGGTKRAGYPALTAILHARRGDANIARVSVALPHSQFLAQEHIGTICTRKRFAAHSCPKKAIYGIAKAWTPLLGKPLEGPVYLRSSDNPLPDLVAALGGELDVNLVGRIDSKNGGIRTTFETVPDAPVTKFVLRMYGGGKSLLTNSVDICRGMHRATVNMSGQNGRARDFRPELGVKCGLRSG